MGDHENGSASPHLAFQPFRDQAHNSARQDRWLTHQESVSCGRKRRRRRWQAVAFVRRTGWTGAHPCTRKGQILSADVLHGLCFLPSIRYSAAVPPPHSPQKTALTCHCRSIRYSCAGLPLLLFSILNNAMGLISPPKWPSVNPFSHPLGSKIGRKPMVNPSKWVNLKSNFLKFHHRNQVILGIEKARKWRISGLF